MTKKYIFLIIALVIVTVGAGFLLMNKTPELKSTQAENQKPGLVLKTYESQKYKLIMRYPSNWYVYDELGIIISPEKEEVLMNQAGAASFNITGISQQKVQPDEESDAIRQTADSWIKIMGNSSKDVDVELIEDEIIIDDKIIIRVKLKNIKMEAPTAPLSTEDYVLGNGTMYFFIHRGQKIRMAYIYPVQDEDKYMIEFEQIISSLKFK